MKQNQILRNNDEVADILTTLKLFGVNNESFNNMLDELPVYLWVHDENYEIVYSNRDFKEDFRDFLNQPCYQCLMGEENVCACCPSKKLFENGKLEQCKLCRRGNSGSGYDINLFHTLITNDYGRRYILKL